MLLLFPMTMNHSSEETSMPNAINRLARKLTWEDVENMRREYDTADPEGKLPTQRELSDKYGIKQPTVCAILKNKIWRVENAE